MFPQRFLYATQQRYGHIYFSHHVAESTNQQNRFILVLTYFCLIVCIKTELDYCNTNNKGLVLDPYSTPTEKKKKNIKLLLLKEILR